MKQAILITAYKNIHQLVDIINYFPNNFLFYIHIDRKSKLDLTPIKRIQDKSIYISTEYNINWGGLNHLKAILWLANEALKNNENTFFHLITGEDYPVKPVKYFEEHLDKSKDYLIYFEMPSERWIENGGMDRVDYYNLYDFFNAKNEKEWNKIFFLIEAQKKLKIKRSYPNNFPKLYGGSTYWSLTRTTLQYVINYTQEHKKFLHRMKFTFCAEEMYFQTVIMNSKFSSNVVNDDLRYIDWSSGEASPAILNANDFSKIIFSNKIFARKFDAESSKELKLLLTAHYQKNSTSTGL